MKKSTWLLACGVLAASFAACGKSDGGGDGDGDQPGDGDGDQPGDGDGDGDVPASGGTAGDGDGDETGGSAGDNQGGGSGDGDGDTTTGGSPNSCDMQSDCDDDDTCTDEACQNDVCEYAPVAGSFCTNGANQCLGETLTGLSPTVCIESASDEMFDICHEGSECPGELAPAGCPLNMTLGEATYAKSIVDSTRTTIMTIPIVDISMTGPFDFGDSDCVISLDVLPTAPLYISLTMTSEVANSCTEGEEILQITSEVDASSVVATVSPGEGDTALCNAAHIALQSGELRNDLVAGLEEYIAGSLAAEDITGDECLVCSGGPCTGLTCAPSLAPPE